MKLCVTTAGKHEYVKDLLLSVGDRWQWAVRWLKEVVQTPYEAMTYTSASHASSNEGSHSNVFQRTTSAQVWRTLHHQCTGMAYTAPPVHRYGVHCTTSAQVRRTHCITSAQVNRTHCTTGAQVRRTLHHQCTGEAYTAQPVHR